MTWASGKEGAMRMSKGVSPAKGTQVGSPSHSVLALTKSNKEPSAAGAEQQEERRGRGNQQKAGAQAVGRLGVPL